MQHLTREEWLIAEFGSLEAAHAYQVEKARQRAIDEAHQERERRERRWRFLQPRPAASVQLEAAQELVMKKSALVEKFSRVWPTVENDLKEALTNGLAEARVRRGFYSEVKAVQWAKSRGKMRARTGTQSTASPFPAV